MIKESVYHVTEAVDTSGLDFNLLEAKLNVMEATFLVLQSNPSLNKDALDEGLHTFQTLFNRYFKEDMQVQKESSCMVFKYVTSNYLGHVFSTCYY